MDWQDWMYVRALLPSGVILVAVTLLAILLQQVSVSPYLAAFAGLPVWVFLGGLAFAAVVAISPARRLWLWERGGGLLCPKCGGPVGDCIPGRFGPYYKCLRCRGNSAAHQVE